MKLKNMWKRFWTLDVHNHEGFTLVELIIVIAILAILSTGAIAGYSAYVESANKTADKAMIAEIENVLLMAYYNGDITTGGQFMLTADGIDRNSVGTEIAEALQAAYGANWDTALKLKYNWQFSYADTSFAGHEEALLNKVDTLTEKLGDAIKDSGGANFDRFMTENNIDPDDAGSAAVLYVAQATAALKTAEQKQKFKDAFALGDPAQIIGSLSSNVFNSENGGYVAAVASVYALAEVYCMDKGLSNTIQLDTTNITDPSSAATAVGEYFLQIYNADPEGMEKYMQSGLADDAAAYLDVMTTVNSSKNAIISNGLGNFSTLTPMFQAYAGGGVGIIVDIDGADIVSNTLPNE